MNTKDHDFPNDALQEWQDIIDLVVRLAGARVGLIMRTVGEDIEVLVASNTPNNPYPVGAREHLADSGLYCETVIRRQQKLRVANALKSDQWKNNPDLKYGLLGYLGFPIRFPDGKSLGTICLLDDKEKAYTPDIESLMSKMRDLIEGRLRLMQAHAEIAAANAELKRLASIDPLTGSGNRRHFEEALAFQMAQARRDGAPLSLLLLDLDHFKSINDTYGHPRGDQVLIEVSHRLRSKLRTTDRLARWGGEEFAVLLPHCDATAGANVAEQLRALIAGQPFPEVGTVTASFGVAELKSDEKSAEWFKRVDFALYEAKLAGRNAVRVSA